jgi:hypothetical protein
MWVLSIEIMCRYDSPLYSISERCLSSDHANLYSTCIQYACIICNDTDFMRRVWQPYDTSAIDGTTLPPQIVPAPRPGIPPALRPRRYDGAGILW